MRIAPLLRAATTHLDLGKVKLNTHLGACAIGSAAPDENAELVQNEPAVMALRGNFLVVAHLCEISFHWGIGFWCVVLSEELDCGSCKLL